MDEFSRTRLLLGQAAMDRLNAARVAVFGIGGVGSYTIEALARSGVGALAIFDDDSVCLSNINRQLIATHQTLGKQKVEVMAARIHEINPLCCVEANECFYGPETAEQYDLTRYNYIVDAIDTVSSKLLLIERAKAVGVPIISCMGAGNKLDPTRFEVADIYSTSVCPLARVMRHELKARGIRSLKVVYSREEALQPMKDAETGDAAYEDCPQDGGKENKPRRLVPGSIAFVPSVAGLILAGEVIKDLAGISAKAH